MDNTWLNALARVTVSSTTDTYGDVVMRSSLDYFGNVFCGFWYNNHIRIYIHAHSVLKYSPFIIHRGSFHINLWKSFLYAYVREWSFVLAFVVFVLCLMHVLLSKSWEKVDIFLRVKTRSSATCYIHPFCIISVFWFLSFNHYNMILFKSYC